MPVDRDLTEALLEVIRECMEQEGLSGKRLAEAAGITPSTLSRQLRSQGVITVDELDALARALGTDLEQLLSAARRRV